MTTHDKITEARLVNGKVYVKQAGGTYEETTSQTDWAHDHLVASSRDHFSGRRSGSFRPPGSP